MRRLALAGQRRVKEIEAQIKAKRKSLFDTQDEIDRKRDALIEGIDAMRIEIGVDDYLGKPYQEAQLLEAIEPLVSKRRAPAVASGAGRRR